MYRLSKTAVAAAAVCVLLAGLPAAGFTDTEAVRTDEVCFRVHNEGDPLPATVYGVRYYRGTPGPATKVIVLVHGASITHTFWDLRPDFSVARRLAQAGYLVIAYDRLGYAKSPYRRPPGAGYTLTWSSQRAMLHEIVSQLKTGDYSFSVSDECSTSPGPVVGLASRTIILVGHSGGGIMVSGYPGLYHDVAAVVQAGWSNQGTSPDGALYITTTFGAQLATGRDYANLFPNPDGCRRALLYLPGVEGLLPSFCEPTSFTPSPAGELTGIAGAVAENLVAIARVGPDIPVLLAFEDRDFFFPTDRNTEEFEYWKAHCGCDVESWTQERTGHALIAHRSMPSFTSKIVAWLASRGLPAK